MCPIAGPVYQLVRTAKCSQPSGPARATAAAIPVAEPAQKSYRYSRPTWAKEMQCAILRSTSSGERWCAYLSIGHTVVRKNT